MVKSWLMDEQAHRLEVVQHAELFKRAQGIQLQLLVLLGVDPYTLTVFQVVDLQLVTRDDNAIGGTERFFAPTM